jgi:hypothetical protein
MEEDKLIGDKRLLIFQNQFVSLQLSLSVPGKHHKTDHNRAIYSDATFALKMLLYSSSKMYRDLGKRRAPSDFEGMPIMLCPEFC